MKYIIAIFILLLSILLFKKAAGNLKFKLMNIISYSFYSLLLFDFIGITLIYLGFKDHYLIAKVFDNLQVVNFAYWSMAWVMIVLPLSVIIFNKYIYKINDIGDEFVSNIKKNVSVEHEENKKVFIVCIVTFIICLMATIYVFVKIGYIPFLKLFEDGFDFATERIKSGRNFLGSLYIKNIIMLILTPFISYLSYTYMRVTKEKKWKILFSLTLVLCILVKTYDFSKSPIVYYFLYFVFIEISLGNFKKFIYIIPYALGTIILVVSLYLSVSNYNGSFVSLSNGPLSRVVISQPGALLLHFETFPKKIPYLKGHSFPKIFRYILGSGEYGVRSGRKVMEIYNKEAINNGTAGVMSTVFIGEAYANFGLFGLLISPILVSFILSSCMCIYLKIKKTPLNICLYLETIIIYISIIQGGFVEFIYNVSLIIILLFITIVKIFINHKYLLDKFHQIKFKNKKEIEIDDKKRMIFHIPNYLDSKRKSGSQIRPLKMIEAFKKIGYEVDVVMGYGKERLESISEIERKISNGIKYDFLYSESSTMPTLLTEKNHLPLYHDLDFSFFRFCKNNNIKIGLFYRDIYWKFDEYKLSVSKVKRIFTFPMYKYDLYKYKKLVDVLFLPSIEMSKYLPEINRKIKIECLPPGIDINYNYNYNKNNDKRLNILYVGGITEPNGIYGVLSLMKTTQIDKRIFVYICCRIDDWNKVKNSYSKYLNKNIKIIHVSGKELENYYKIADLCSLIFPYNEYRAFSMPIKFFEYLSHGLPVITTPDTVAAKFIQKYNIGFVVKDSDIDIQNQIKKILDNKKILTEKKTNIIKMSDKHTWEARAKTVHSNLKHM